MQWERRQRRLTAPAFILDPIDFGERWRKWITSMMPGWRTRKSTEWPLPREDRPDERWDAIRKGGRDGVLLLVLSLSWWKHATTPGTKARDEYESAVEELAWLLQQLVRVPPSALPVTSSASRTSSVQPDFVPPQSSDGPPSSELPLAPVQPSAAGRKPKDPVNASPPSPRLTRSKVSVPTGPVTRKRTAPPGTLPLANKRRHTGR